ncbi:GNAT family N-acetyltransferase [Pseudomonas sp. EMN2]|uniref:GNAT family N-acetyltransferase n=1 Tax=Pseudomonas sp. EMN2 TaxID=2615212 RepID=UPI00129B42FD|nr:GNAT family N-acetyltransferase [Pseudomonas sp. EMN2]
MVKVVVFDSTPLEHVTRQVLRLVEDNASELSSWSIPRSNIQYEFHQWALVAEVKQYLQLMGKLSSAPSELAVALDDAANVIGFVLYLPTPTNPEACGISYMAVAAGARRQGVARAMMEQLVERYPHVELTCAVHLVPLYERIGFQVIEGSDHPTQVVMNTRSYSTTAEMRPLNVEDLFHSEEAQRFKQRFVREHGRAAVVQSDEQIYRHIKQLQQQVQFYVSNRRAVRWMAGAESLAAAVPDGQVLLSTFEVVLRFLVDNGLWGACHDSSAILYMLLLEQGVQAELIIGEVHAQGMYFDHSWVEVGGLIYDPAVGFPRSEEGKYVGPSVFASRELGVLQVTDLGFGAVSPQGFCETAQEVATFNLKQYAKKQPAGTGIWDVAPRLAAKLGMKRIPRDFKAKYGAHTRTLRKVEGAVPVTVG